jgi:tRNA-splicing ligase RtcB
MRPKELVKLGVPRGPALDAAIEAVRAASKFGYKKGAIRREVRMVLASPADHLDHQLFGAVARSVVEQQTSRSSFEGRKSPAPSHKWGSDLEPGAVTQLDNACALPVSVAAALMPDAHLGYGLPIGGVLATKDAVIPYAVGVDIACRMRLSVLDWPVSALERKRAALIKALERETAFGLGASFHHRRQHPVMDRDWSVSPITEQGKDRAWAQLGTSGSGNHFVEYGTLTLERDELGLEAGTYLALLSHSGSRGTGNQVARHYSSLAMDLHPELPKELRHLAWLDLDSEAGQEYWQAMSLMGDYAAANHELIHTHVTTRLGAEVIAEVENHHNFAWRERHLDQDVIVHRKGATPAAAGVLGVIPGSMAAPGYVVRGRGNPESLLSAAHGAGRRMSRKAAKKRFDWGEVQRFLQKKRVKLLSAGLDEAPLAYKDIDAVMAAQRDLVEPIARFDPRIVKMAPAGEKPED